MGTHMKRTNTSQQSALILYENAATITWSSPNGSESVNETQIHHNPAALASHLLTPPYRAISSISALKSLQVL